MKWRRDEREVEVSEGQESEVEQEDGYGDRRQVWDVWGQRSGSLLSFRPIINIRFCTFYMLLAS